MTGTSSATPALRWSRATLLATVVLVVSALGHVSADGRLPGPAALVALLATTTLVSSAFLVRQASPLRIVTLLVVGQGVIHGALTLLAGHGTPGEAGHATPGEAGHATPGVGHVVDHLAEQGAAMLLAHLVAVVLVGAWLAVGERALWTLLSLGAAGALSALSARFAHLLGQPVRWLLERVGRKPFPRAATRVVVPRPHLLPQVVARRGPPALLAA